MDTKRSQYIEMLFVYIVVCLIVTFFNFFVSLGGAAPVRMVIAMLLYIIMAGVPLAISRYRKISFSQLGFRKAHIGKQMVSALCIFAVTICMTVFIPLLIGMHKNDVLNFKPSSAGILLFYILYDLLFVGFGEEFIFRGYFYTRLGMAMRSKFIPVLFSSLLFGFWHYPHGQNILQVIATTVLGLIYGFSRGKFKHCSLLSVSFAHGLQDAAIIVLSYFLL